MLDAEGAWAHGWCDMLGTLESARALAAMAGEGQPLPKTPRAEMLAAKSRAPLPALSAPGARAALKTSDFARDGFGNATAGARMVANTLSEGPWAAGSSFATSPVGRLFSNGGRVFECVAVSGSAPYKNVLASGVSPYANQTYSAGARVTYQGQQYVAVTSVPLNNSPGYDPVNLKGFNTSYWYWEGPTTGPSGNVTYQIDGQLYWTTWTPLQLSPAGMKIGGRTLDQAWFGSIWTCAGVLRNASGQVLSWQTRSNSNNPYLGGFTNSPTWAQVSVGGPLEWCLNLPLGVTPTNLSAISVTASPKWFQGGTYSSPFIVSQSTALVQIGFWNIPAGNWLNQSGYDPRNMIFELDIHVVGYSSMVGGIWAL
jgi:hypothetical protein